MAKRFRGQFDAIPFGKMKQSLEHARDDEKSKGVICPCCGRLAAVYRRSIHAEAAKFLVLLHRALRDPEFPKEVDEKGFEWVSTRALFPRAPKSATDGAFLTRWKLVRRRPGDAGWYRTTKRGRRFVRGEISVPRSIILRNDQARTFMRFEGEHITIHDALGDKFNLDDIWPGRR